jgi:tetratricopeptide (TPR) repeat protein
MNTLDEAEKALRAKRYKEAHKMYLSMLNTVEPHPRVYAGLATTAYFLREFEEAYSYANQALVLKEDLAQAHLVLAYVLGRRGDLDLGLVHANRALELVPDMPEALSYAGGLFIRKGDIPAGAALVEHAIQLDPSLWTAHANLGQLYLLKKELRGSRREFWTAFRLNPSRWTLWALMTIYFASYRLWFVGIPLIAIWFGFARNIYWIPATFGGILILIGFIGLLAGQRRGWVGILAGSFMLLVCIILTQRLLDLP